MLHLSLRTLLLTTTTTGREIEKSCAGIYPIQNVYIRKVKVLRTPKFDQQKLMEIHGDYTEIDTGSKLDRPAEETEEVAAAE